jgi:AcrR family transcriptional regulator
MLVREPATGERNMDATTRAASSRERILQSGKHLFSSRGFENTSTIMIARAAGTSESQLVKHFGSKDGLLEAIFDQGWALLGDVFHSSAKASTGPQRLMEMLQKVWQGLERDPETKELMLLESRRIRKHGQVVLVTRSFIEFTARLDALFTSMQEQGELRPDLRPELVRSAVLGVCEGLLRDQLLARRSGDESGFHADDMQKTLEAVLIGFLTPERAVPATSSR